MTMDSPRELTTIIRMKRDFADFIGHQNSSSSSSSCNLSKKRKSLKCSLDFDQTLAEFDSNNESGSFREEQERLSTLREAERLADKSDIAHLKTQIANLEAKLERDRIEAEKLCNVEKQEKEQCFEKMSELKMKLKSLCQKDNQLKDEIEEKNDRLNEKENEIIQLRKEKTNADCKHEKVKLKNEQEISELRDKLFQSQTSCKRYESQLEEANDQISNLKSKSSKFQDRITELEQCKNQASVSDQLVKELELKLQRQAEDAILMRNMKSRLSKMPELEKEVDVLRTHNINLRDNQEKTAVLKEMLEGCQKKLIRYEQQLSQYSAMEVSLEEANKKLKEWQTLDGSNINPLTPSVVRNKWSELQKNEAILLEKDGKLKTLVLTQENEIKRLQNQVQKLQSNLENEQKANNHYNDMVKTLNKRCIRLEKERDGYKQIIASYDNDLTIMSSESLARSRIQALEEMVNNLRSSLETNENELHRVKEQLLESSSRTPDLQKLSHPLTKSPISVIDQKMEMQLRQTIEELEKRLEKVNEEKCILEMRIQQRNLQGDYDPSKTKVLHMKINPTSVNQQIRQQKMSKLEEEVERLRTRVKVLEESGPQAMNVTLQVDQKLQEDCNCKQVVDEVYLKNLRSMTPQYHPGLTHYVQLKSQLESAELKNKRLLQTFKETSQEVREMTYLLTGYRLDIKSTGIYKLTNIYAASGEDYLLFKREQSSALHLLESPFSKTTENLMDIYLKKQHSIPAYLSSITLELLNQQ